MPTEICGFSGVWHSLPLTDWFHWCGVSSRETWPWMTVVRGYLTSSAFLWLLSVVLVYSCREVCGLFLFSFIHSSPWGEHLSGSVAAASKVASVKPHFRGFSLLNTFMNSCSIYPNVNHSSWLPGLPGTLLLLSELRDCLLESISCWRLTLGGTLYFSLPPRSLLWDGDLGRRQQQWTWWMCFAGGGSWPWNVLERLPLWILSFPWCNQTRLNGWMEWSWK